MTGTVDAIFTAPGAGAPMERRERVAARRGGFVRDRYYEGTGRHSPFDVCEVTLVSAAALDRVRGEHGIDLSDGRHRRNPVVSGVDVHDLLDATVRVGGAELRGTRPRPPCAHVEVVTPDPETMGERIVERLREGADE